MRVLRGVQRRDAALPLAVAVLATVETASYGPPQLAAVLAVEWAACLLLVLRRRFPWPACTAVGALMFSLSLLDAVIEELATPLLVLVVAGFSLGRYLADLRGLLSMAAFLAMGVVHETSNGMGADITDVVFLAATMLPPYLFGRLLRTLAVRNEQLAEQAAELLRLQAQVRQEAVSAERARIARELHDVIAHSVSAMVVQASAAEDLARTDADRAAGVMRDVADTGRRALAETGRLLHLIRDTDDELGLAPDAGLDRLDELVEQFRRSGLDVRLQVDGSLEALPAGVDVSGYRIVQEALTNALKHAADGVAQVRVRREADVLRIDAENAGTPGLAGPGSGLGLAGMTERVQVFGGRLSTGFTDDSRFVLSAQLPLAGPA